VIKEYHLLRCDPV